MLTFSPSVSTVRMEGTPPPPLPTHTHTLTYNGKRNGNHPNTHKQQPSPRISLKATLRPEKNPRFLRGHVGSSSCSRHQAAEMREKSPHGIVWPISIYRHSSHLFGGAERRRRGSISAPEARTSQGGGRTVALFLSFSRSLIHDPCCLDVHGMD